MRHIFLLLLTLVPSCVHAQSVACKPDTTPPDAADLAFFRDSDYVKAIGLYRADIAKNPTNDHDRSMIVRALVERQATDDAEKEAAAFLKEKPDSSAAEGTMSLVLYSKGDLAGSYAHAAKALALNPCDSYAHQQMGRLSISQSMWASAEVQYDIAHKLAPNDDEIRNRWLFLQDQAAVVADLTDALQNSPYISPKDIPSYQRALAAAKISRRSDCSPNDPSASDTIKLEPHYQERPVDAQGMENTGDSEGRWAITTTIGGRHMNLLLNTRYSGILLSRSMARKLNVKAEAEVDWYGKTAQIVHMDVQVGTITFKQCRVLLTPDDDEAADIHGLIGLTTLGPYLLTMDFPARELRLSPLPVPPGPVVPFDQLTDRYIAPEMKDWTKAYRTGTSWYVPTKVTGKKQSVVALFNIDPESQYDYLDLSFAQSVTKLEDEKDTGLSFGPSYNENHPRFTRETLVLQFANVRQSIPRLDAPSINLRSGIKVGGTLGLDSIGPYALQLDYRDGLIHLAPSAKH